MNKKLSSLLAMALATGSMAFADISLIENPTFASYDGWIFGASRFSPKTAWLEFVEAPTAFSHESRVQASGNGFVFQSWDDGIVDKMETYIFNEHKAGPPGDWQTEIFETGDVIVFKGSASATKSGTNTSDVVVQAFIKTLGYGQWAFDVLSEYTVTQDLTETLEPFELRITYPDMAVDDRLQVIQVGFVTITEFDGSNMDAAEIYFENIEAYIEGRGGNEDWAGYAIDEFGDIDTGDWQGILNVTHSPWIYSYALETYIYMDPANVTAGGGWAFVLQ